MKRMYPSEVIAKAMVRIEKRNEPVFDMLRLLGNSVSEPAIDFDPEDGEIEFVWMYNGSSVSIHMWRENGQRSLALSWALPTEHNLVRNPSLAQVQEALAKIGMPKL